jgi:hypothetical protein
MRYLAWRRRWLGGMTAEHDNRPWLQLLERFRSKRAARSETLSPTPAASHLEENVLVYKPEPIDTSNVRLSDEIFQLTEHLAENAHEVWAKQRMNEGWTYGPQRDDFNKKHPSLVPYKDLPEEEKEYDRRTAMETLKVMLALGYRIEKAQ